jgi:hypothetical protein
MGEKDETTGVLRDGQSTFKDNGGIGNVNELLRKPLGHICLLEGG